MKKKATFRELFQLAGEYKGEFTRALICTVFTVLIGYITPLIFSETIDVVLSDGVSYMPEFIKAPIRALGGRAFLRQQFWWIGVALVVLNVVNGVFSYYRAKSTAVAGEEIAKDLREHLYKQLSYLSFGYHTHAETGDLIQRCTSDVDTVRRFMSQQLVEAFRSILMAVIAFVILFERNVEISLFSIILIPPMIAGSYYFFQKITKSFAASDESEGKMSAVLQENLTGVRVVRAFGKQQREVEKFDKASDDYQSKSFHLLKQLSVFWSSMDGITMLQIMITLVVCILKAVRGEISVGTLIVFTSYISMLIYPVRGLGRIMSDAGKSLVSLGRINEVLGENAEGEEAGSLTPPLGGDIVFDHVSFAYEEGNKVLDDISFTIPAGKTVALLGNTGSGKSTIVHLLQRLIAPTAGVIRIGGVDIQQIDRKYLRAHVGLMLQEPFLYGRSIMGNLGIAAPGTSETRIKEMARVAMADGFIQQFDKGYDTMLGERGVTLSGGQRQRIAIARTLLKENDILIFDDSLSAVDMQTDQRIRAELKKRDAGVTTIIISHRVSTLSEAERIYVIENGKLSAEGTHAELVEQGGLYSQIYDIQSALEDDLRQSRDAVAKEE